MKPKPLEALNHFTVPCSFTSHPRLSARLGKVHDICIDLRFLLCVLGITARIPKRRKMAFRTKKGRKDCPCSPSIKPKGITRATNAIKRVPQSGQFVHSYGQGTKTPLHLLR